MTRLKGRRAPLNRYFLPVCVGLLTLVVGCAGDKEALRKSQGHYQEGIASLPGDRQKAFVSFHRAVQLNPANKEARYALGHVYVLQGKLPPRTQKPPSLKGNSLPILRPRDRLQQPSRHLQQGTPGTTRPRSTLWSQPYFASSGSSAGLHGVGSTTTELTR